MLADRDLEKGISEIAGIFTDPIIVSPGGWGANLPPWLKEAITLDRLIEGMKSAGGDEMMATDAEACAYLMTACLEAAPSYEWAQIYLYVATRVLEKYRNGKQGFVVPADVRVDLITDDMMRDLNHLKRWIYEQRVRRRHEKGREERRHKKEAAAAQAKELQPSMFDLFDEAE